MLHYGFHKWAITLFISFFIVSCDADQNKKARATYFIGVDISGSFMRGPYFEDSLRFLATYIYIHTQGLGGAEIPASLFVGSIGGSKPGEPKTFYPIEDFKYAKSTEEIFQFLKRKFPESTSNPFTDYNAFFKQIRSFVQQRKLESKPTTIMMVSDGEPDVAAGKEKIRQSFCGIDLLPLEKLTRNITLRLLYTNATLGEKWKTLVERDRVKIFTQDAEVMTSWKKDNILLPDRPIEKQERLLDWIRSNVDFGVPRQRVKSACAR